METTKLEPQMVSHVESSSVTNNKPNEKGKHYQKRMVLYVICMSFGSITFGYASAVIATTLGQPSFQEYMNLTADNPDTARLEGAMNSLFYAGGFGGAVFNSWYADRLGRKTAIATGCVIVLISAALCAGSVNIAMFIVFRFCTGWGCLMLLVSVPLWITEIAPPTGRGILANIHALQAVIGYLIAAYVGVGFYYAQNGTGNQWRGPLAIACLFPLITLAFIPILPESPRYLLKKGHTDKARRIVEQLHHNSADTNSDYARREFLQMQAQLEMDRELDSSWRILFTRPSYRRRVLISSSLLTFLYSSGTIVLTNYAPELYVGLGFNASQALLCQSGTIVNSLSAILFSFLIVDRIPRNVLLGGGMFLCTIPLALEAAMDALYAGTSNKAGNSAGIAFIFLYLWLYTATLDGPGYFYASEVFPTHLRSKGATINVVGYSLINIMWLQVAPIAFQNIGWKFYMVFVCCALAGSVVMFFTFPDTLNKPLEEVAEIFGDEDLVAHYRGHATAMIGQASLPVETPRPVDEII